MSEDQTTTTGRPDGYGTGRHVDTSRGVAFGESGRTGRHADTTRATR